MYASDNNIVHKFSILRLLLFLSRPLSSFPYCFIPVCQYITKVCHSYNVQLLLHIKWEFLKTLYACAFRNDDFCTSLQYFDQTSSEGVISLFPLRIFH